MYREAATMVQDKRSPLHVRWHTFPKDLVHVSTQVRESQSSLGNAVLIAIRVASKQDIIIWAVFETYQCFEGGSSSRGP